jgi:hypothetical protein
MSFYLPPHSLWDGSLLTSKSSLEGDLEEDSGSSAQDVSETTQDCDEEKIYLESESGKTLIIDLGEQKKPSEGSELYKIFHTSIESLFPAEIRAGLAYHKSVRAAAKSPLSYEVEPQDEESEDDSDTRDIPPPRSRIAPLSCETNERFALSPIPRDEDQ